MTRRTITNLLLAVCLPAVSSLAGESSGDLAAAFRKECSLKVAGSEAMVIPGKEGWYFFKGELRHVGAGEFWGPASEKVSMAGQPDSKDPLPAVLHYKEQLEKLGIDLVLVPIPPKAVIYPDKLLDSIKTNDARLDSCHQEF